MRAVLALLGLLLASPLPAEVEVALVTIGPGAEFWSSFGHNALLVRRPGRPAQLYNFGVFDPDEPGFLGRFLRGEMIYRLEAWSPATLEAYRREGRRIELDRLALPPARGELLAAFLERQARPEHARYRYHYFLDNCSTRVRDALDLALDGALARDGRARSRGLSYRYHALRLAAAQPWLWAAIDLGLGQPADRPLSRWEEAFLPELLREHLLDLDRILDRGGASGGPVADGEVLAPGWLPPPPPVPPDPLFAFLLAGVAVALLLAFALDRRATTPARCLAVLALALFWLLAGLVGSALALLWLVTAHDVAARNENLLLLNPLALPLLAALPALWHDRRVSTGLRRLAMLVAALALFAPLSKGLPMFPQPNLHWIALFLPLHLAAARALHRSGERP